VIKRLVILFSLVFLICISAHTQINIRNYVYVGRNEIYRHNYTTAIGIFNTIIKVKPNHYEAYFYRGVSKFRLDDYRGALKDLDKSIQLNSYNSEVFLYRGIVKDLLFDYYSALEDFNKGIELDPKHVYMYFNRGITRLRLKNYISAVKDFSSVIRFKPDFIAAYINRGIAKDQLFEWEAAVADFSTAIRLNPFSSEAYSRRGMVRALRKDYDLAMQDLNEAIKLDPGNSLSYYFRASIKYELKDLEGTISDYNEVIKLDPENALTFYNRAIIKSQIADYNSAIEDYDEVSKLNPNNVFTYYNRGLVKYEIGIFDGAIEDFTKAIEIYPDFAKAYMARGSAKNAIGDTKGAIADNNTAEIKVNIYKSMQNTDDQFSFADTSRNFQDIIALNSDFGRKMSGDKIINGRIQDREVEIELEPVFKFITTPEDSLIGNDNLYIIPLLDNINRNTGSELKLYLAGRINNQENQDINTKLKILDSTSLENKSPDIYHLFKSVISSAGRNYNTAIIESDKSILYQPDSAHLFFNRANIRLEMIELIASVDNSNNYLSITGNNNIDEKSISGTEFFNYDQVINDFEKSILLNPDFAFSYFNMANVNCLARNFEDAVEYYNKAIGKMPDMAEAYYNRGLTLIYLNKTSDACIDLGKAGELGLYNAYAVIKRYCNEETKKLP